MAIIRSLAVIVSMLFTATVAFAEPLPSVSNLAEQYEYFIKYREDKRSDIADKISIGKAEAFFADVYKRGYQPFQFKFAGMADNVFEITFPMLYHTMPDLQHYFLYAVHYPSGLGHQNVDTFLYNFALDKYQAFFPININIEVDDFGGTAFNEVNVYTYVISQPKENSNFISIIYYENADKRRSYAYPEALNFDLKTGKLLYAEDFIVDKQKFMEMEEVLLAMVKETAGASDHSHDSLFAKGTINGYKLNLNYVDMIEYFGMDADKLMRLNMALDANGIVMFFRTYESHAIGTVYFTLAKDKLNDFGLRSDFWD